MQNHFNKAEVSLDSLSFQQELGILPIMQFSFLGFYATYTNTRILSPDNKLTILSLDVVA